MRNKATPERFCLPAWDVGLDMVGSGDTLNASEQRSERSWLLLNMINRPIIYKTGWRRDTGGEKISKNSLITAYY